MALRARPTVSAVVITFNEERHIPACLESVRWVDEIVVVDSESRDRTVELAKKYAEKVFVRPWPGFPVQRNFGIAQATGDWIVVLDADERVPPEARAEIEAFLGDADRQGYAAAQVPRRNIFFGRWLRYGGAYPDLQWRIFKKGCIRYDERTLDTPVVDGPSRVLTQPFDHFTGDTIGDRLRKIQRETEYKARERLATQRRVTAFDLVGRPLGTFVKTFVTKQGFRDGTPGVVYAALASLYTYVRYVKLWELTRE